MPKSRRVVGILAHGKDISADDNHHPFAVVARITDFFIIHLPRVVSGPAVVDGQPTLSVMSLGFDPRGGDAFYMPRRFCVWTDHKGIWHVEAFFGQNGSREQAIEFLKVLQTAEIDQVTAFGPSYHYWHEEKISPADIIAQLETSLTPAQPVAVPA